MRAVWLLAMWIVMATAGCASAQSAAARDPIKCERDPNCARARGSYADCTRQCVDAPDCMQRCEEIQKHVDSAGH